MHFQRPIIYCAFSNDAEYTLRLFEEEGCISTVLTELDKQGKIEYKHKDKSSLDNVYDFFNDYHNRVFIFHYGGHSDSEFLHFHEHSARSEPLATLIGQQKHLKLVFLNGCANRPQVQALLHQGVPAIIATRESVGDNQAIVLAEQFYKALANGKTIQQSFEAAKSYLQQKHGDRELVRERGCRPRAESPDHPFPWGLYYENEAVLDWHIGQAEQESKIEILSQLREASRKRHQKFTSPGGRFQHLDIQQAILAGIRDIAPNRTVRFEENVDLDGERLPLLESLSSLWGSANPHSLVVGAGGMGKTVSLLRLWKRWSVEEREDIPVPIFIQLNEFNNNPEQNFIQNYIRRHYADLELDEVLKTPAIGQGGKPQPHILLLLDGFNEVTATSNELILEINRLRVQEDYPGIQMVLSSRVDIRSTYQWQSFHLLELQPLSDPQIQAYLREGFPSDSRLLEVLRNPMMLSIYATQSELPKRYLEKGLLKEEVTSTGEMLFNVEAIQRIKIEEQFSIQPGALLLHRFVLEHLLPLLGWRMQQSGSFFLEETGLHQFLGEVPEHLLQKDFFLVFKDFRKLDREALKGKEAWELQEELIDQICCRGLTMLVAENNSYRFLHQNFRDYFAARYLQNQIKLALYQKILPEAFRQAQLDFYVRQILGELESEHQNRPIYLESERRWSADHFIKNNLLAKLLEQCRGIFNSDMLGFTVWNILTIWKEKRGELSGVNLQRLNLQYLMLNNIRYSRPNLPSILTGGIINEENLFPAEVSFIERIAYSPDDKHVAILGMGLHIWNIISEKCVLTLTDHTDSVNCVTFSPDGKHIASGSSDKTIKLWDAQDGNCILSLGGNTNKGIAQTIHQLILRQYKKYKGHSDCILSVAFSLDGKYLISGSKDKTAKIWDTRSAQCILTLKGHTEEINSVAYSPDGERVLTGSKDTTAKIWDSCSGQCLITLEGHSGEISSVAYSPDGRRALTGSYDTTVKIWDAYSGKQIMILETDKEPIMGIAINLNGKRIISSSSHNIDVWEADNGQHLFNLKFRQYLPRCADFSSDGKNIVIGSEGGLAQLWDIQSGTCYLVLQGHTNWVYGVVYHPDGKHIATGSWDNTAKIWDIQSGKCILTLIGHSEAVNHAAFSPDGRHIVTSSGDGTAKLWNVQSDQCLLTLTGHSWEVMHAAFSPDGQHIITGSKDGTAKVWNVQSGQCLLTLEHSDMILKVAYSLDGEFILTGSFQDGIKIWHAQSGNCLLGLEISPFTPLSSIAFNSKKNRMITCTMYNSNQVWDISSRQCILTLSDPVLVWYTTFNQQGDYVLTCSAEGWTRLWDMRSGKNLKQFPDCGFIFQGCDFRNLHPDSELSPESIALLRQYGAIFTDDDAQNWSALMEKHFGIKASSNSYLH